MSVLHHDNLLENLEVWLHDNGLWFKDHKIDSSGFYFEREGVRVDVPDELQDVCQIAKHSLQENKS